MDLEASIRESASKLAATIDGKDTTLREALIQLTPILVDGFADMLAQSMSDPLVHLAIYLMRHNPRHVRAAPSLQDDDRQVREAYLRLYKQCLMNPLPSEGQDGFRC